MTEPQPSPGFQLYALWKRHYREAVGLPPWSAATTRSLWERLTQVERAAWERTARALQDNAGDA
jgi:hypothetical protein